MKDATYSENGMVKIDGTEVRVIGADPAPKNGIDYFDGEKFGHIDADERCREEFAKLSDNKGINLIAWDAPISFDKKHRFYCRPIDNDSKGDKGKYSPIRQWIKDNEKHIEKSSVSIRPFSGCSHWALSCECLGMPYGNSKGDFENYKIAENKKCIEEAGKGKISRFVIEVHPAVSMAVWWVTQVLAKDGDYGKFPKYKGSNISVSKKNGAIETIWDAFDDWGLVPEETELPKNKKGNWDDNKLDAWVAWKMGVDFLQGKAEWVGSPNIGGFVLPKVSEKNKDEFDLKAKMDAFEKNNSLT